MRRASLPTGTLAIAVLLALAGPARAGRNIGVVVTGESWMQPQLAAQIATWLNEHGHTPTASTLDPETQAALNDCFVMHDERCARGVVEKAVRAPSVFYARIDTHSNGSDVPDLTVTAYLFDRGHDAIAEKTTCQRCNDQSLRTAADAILQKLVGGGELGHLGLKSAPPGARITIDGAAIGITPLDWDLPPGKHTIQMDKPGRRSGVRDHVVVSNKTDLVVMTLPPDDRADQPSRVVPLALMIGGGAAVVAGAGLIAFSPGPDPHQRYYYRTWPPGIAVTAGGAVLAGVGAYLRWFRSPAATSAPVASFTGDAAYVGWAGWF
ncbi:MAG TPA: PEGA domain-containing protein [Kofleriaceae bacterium]